MTLTYIELGRPKDLIKGGLNLLIGTILIIKYKLFTNIFSFILFAITILITFYMIEVFTLRWNQLTEQEKYKLKTILEFKKKISVFFEAIYLATKKFLDLINFVKLFKANGHLAKKLWVRNDDNGKVLNIDKNQLVNLEMAKKEKIELRDDIIEEEKK